jgi:type II secretory pathway component PulJ
VVILYDVELLLTLLIGAAIGVLVTAAHYEQAARRRWAYEKEIAEGREIYAALAMYRRIRPVHPSDDEERLT